MDRNSCNTPTREVRERLIAYTAARRCRGGGYCFYRLEEPSGADTLYALSIYAFLGVPRGDETTRQYLQHLQRSDGSYESAFSAFFALKGLALMGEQPVLDPSEYLLDQIEQYRFISSLAPSDVQSPFKKLLCVVESLVLAGADVLAHTQEKVLDYLESFKKTGGGYGMERATLLDTWHVLSILCHVRQCGDDGAIRTFIESCEDPGSGFVGVPGSSLTSIEHIHAGVSSSRLLSRKPAYLHTCLDFVRFCQRNNGGFARSIGGGIATLENSYHAAAVYADVSASPVCPGVHVS